VIKIPGYYELRGKLTNLKEKYKKDTSRLKSQIKEQMERIEELKERINKILSEDHYYQFWLKEREELIKKAKENNDLIEEIINLKKRLTNEINRSVVEEKIQIKEVD